MLVIILCGHGEEGTGDILVGGQGFMDNPLTKRIVEDAVDGINIPQDQVFLVSTACYSGLWRSPKWTLLAGAEACDESIAMAQSGSGEFRGGVSTYAALAERADEFGLTAPHPIAMQYDADAVFADDQFRRNHSTVAGKLSSPRTLESPRRSGTKAYEFMDALRKTMRHTYAVSKSVLDLGSDTPSTFLLRPFTAEYGERLVLIGASPGPPSKPEIPRSASGSRCNVRTPRPPPPPPPLPLSTVDAKELLCLAREHARFPRADTARDLTVNALAKKLSAGGTLIPSQQKSLLARLRYRARACRRASAMAHYLGWAAARPVEEWGNPSGSKEMREAEEAGAAIATQFISPVAEGAYMGEGQPVWRTMGPGAWLAEAWVKAGRPHVEAGRSDAAVEFANQAADAGGSLARGQMYVDFKE
ncbi:hypothetical protein DFH09DRAFT_1369449 [Mycena vulgaris]|nr:hypothetical protein DFH09DRAFT_1369449 [Mycena vulgaris]